MDRESYTFYKTNPSPARVLHLEHQPWLVQGPVKPPCACPACSAFPIASSLPIPSPGSCRPHTEAFPGRQPFCHNYLLDDVFYGRPCSGQLFCEGRCHLDRGRGHKVGHGYLPGHGHNLSYRLGSLNLGLINVGPLATSPLVNPWTSGRDLGSLPTHPYPRCPDTLPMPLDT